jgi:hypothetical protein
MTEATTEATSQRDQKVQKPDAEYYDDHNSGDLCKRGRKRNLSENPPDQAEDDAHYKYRYQQRKHEAPQIPLNADLIV